MGPGPRKIVLVSTGLRLAARRPGTGCLPEGKSGLARPMHTSRTQVGRALDPENRNVTIETLQKAAAVVGRRVALQLV